MHQPLQLGAYFLPAFFTPCVLSLVGRLADGRERRCNPLRRAEDGFPGDQHCRPGGHDPLRRLWSDAAVYLQLGLTCGTI